MEPRDVIRHLLREKLIACSPETPIVDAAILMKTHDVGAVLVVRDDKPVGIITDRDIVMQCLADEASTRDPVGTVMTSAVETVLVTDSVQSVIKDMRARHVRRVPVVDESGRAVGLLSYGDIFGLLAREMADLSVNTAVGMA